MDLFYLTKSSLLLAVQLSAPPLVAAIVSGVLISLVQTLFSIQDQTLPFTIKLLAIAFMLLATGGWMVSSVLELTELIFNRIVDV